jgi:hypothetical protein
MIGACIIASNVYPYNTTITSGVDGIIVKNKYLSWIKALERLIRDKEYRKSLAGNAQFKLRNNYDYYENIHDWMTVYHNAAGRIYTNQTADIQPIEIYKIEFDRPPDVCLSKEKALSEV